MVQKIGDGKEKILFRCGGCGSRYHAEGHAAACEHWCAERKSCNLDISAFSVETIRAHRPNRIYRYT